jgi:Protein of unknown function (DUF3592)
MSAGNGAKKNPARKKTHVALLLLAGGLFLFTGISLAIATYRRNSQSISLAAHGEKITGFVLAATKTDNQKNGSHVYFSYSVQAVYFEKKGTAHQTVVSVPESLFGKIAPDGEHFAHNQTIDLIFDPSDPSFARLPGDMELDYLGYYLCPIFGVIGLCFFYGVFFPSLRRAKASNADSKFQVRDGCLIIPNDCWLPEIGS